MKALRGGAPGLPRLPFLKRKNQPLCKTILNSKIPNLKKNKRTHSHHAGGAKNLAIATRKAEAGGGANSAAKAAAVNVGRLQLLFVALLYGSLTVVFRYHYSMPGPPTVR